eukprot:6213537-Pleurochrysis_carterae.AAC.1
MSAWHQCQCRAGDGNIAGWTRCLIRYSSIESSKQKEVPFSKCSVADEGKGCECGYNGVARRTLRGVAKVVGVDALCERGARRRLDRDEARRLGRLLTKLLAEKREGDPRKVGAAAGAADDDVR